MIKISRVDFLDLSQPERHIGLGKPHIAGLANISAGLTVPVAVISHQLLYHPATDLTTTRVPRQGPGLVPAVYSTAHFAARARARGFSGDDPGLLGPGPCGQVSTWHTAAEARGFHLTRIELTKF
jgi:hypothetical protein